jgi:biopolymer transport protein ExbD
MMRVPTQVRSGSLGFNMTPMIDVVFLLIIFFLVSSHLAKQEVHMELPLPVANSGTAATESEAPRLTINIRQGGQLRLAGKPVRAEQLKERLATRASEVGRDLEVRIRSDRRVAYRHVEPILGACAQAGIWNVTFAVYRPEDVH